MNDLYSSYATNTTRKRKRDDIKLPTFQFFESLCPTKSGSKTLTFYQSYTDTQLYQEYVKHMEQHGIEPLGEKAFNTLKKQMPIKKINSYWGMFDCLLCYHYQLLGDEGLMTDDEKKKKISICKPYEIKITTSVRSIQSQATCNCINH